MKRLKGMALVLKIPEEKKFIAKRSDTRSRCSRIRVVDRALIVKKESRARSWMRHLPIGNFALVL